MLFGMFAVHPQRATMPGRGSPLGRKALRKCKDVFSVSAPGSTGWSERWRR